MSRSARRNPIHRRSFLASTLVGGLSLGAVTQGIAPAVAQNPPRREGTKFKYSLAAYSYRNLLQGAEPPQTLFDFIDDCARFGLEGTELASYYFPADVTPDYLTRVRKHCFLQGLDISGTAVGNDFGHAAGEQRDEQLQLVKRWVDHATLLGAPVIRIFAGAGERDVDGRELQRRIVSAIEECCQYAGERGIHLALENHGGPTATADGLLAIVRDVRSPWFGVNLDTGNFQSSDVYGDLQRVAPYAINVQVKVAVTGADGTRKPTDYRRLATILREANYRGYVVLEFEEEGDVRVECRRQLDALRQAFA